MPKRTIICLLALVTAAAVYAAAWDPAAFSKLDTLEFRTIGPEEGEHWSTVWLVVLNDQVYIRLGSRAADRIEHNTAKPNVAVRIGGQQFDNVVAQPAPDMTTQVAAAMGEKYWSDVFVRHFNHPLTMRLVPASQ